MSCFGHSLNLAVTNAIKDDARLSRALGVCRKIVSSFSSSWKKKRDLKATQIEKDLPQHSLVAVSIINKINECINQYLVITLLSIACMLTN